MKMSVWSLACQESLFYRYHSDKHLPEFYPQDGGESQLALKLRHCHSVYILSYRNGLGFCSTTCVVVRYGAMKGTCREDVMVTDYGVFYWPRTIHSRRAQLVCPYGAATAAVSAGSAIAYRWCNVSEDIGMHVEWKQPDYSQCSTVDQVATVEW